METSLNCFIAIREVDIGSEAIERGSSFGAPSTLIVKDNPASASGKITSVEIYASLTGDLVNCEIGAFYRPDSDGYPDKFTTRDTYAIGAVIGGSKKTFVVDLDLEEGDYLGITFSSGSIEYNPVNSGYQGIWSVGGDFIPCTNKDFGAIISGATISLKAVNAISSKRTIIDGTLLVNQTGEFFGKTIDGDINVIRKIAGACVDTSQSIRMVITIDGEDVSDSLIGSISIAHNLNYISTFSLQLGDPKYSPLVDSHIAVNSVVIITTFVNGQEIDMFKGLIDSTRTSYDGGYVLTITGRDYGKKLLSKTMTLISVQDSAQLAYRGSMVKFIAEQVDIINVNVPSGDKVTIDHSFQDQSLWDMIQKEAAIEGWYVRFDENAIMQLKTKSLKTTPDWEYRENKFVQLGLETTDRGIINKVTILGAIFEEETITIDVEDDSGNEWCSSIDVPNSEYDEHTVTIEKTFARLEDASNWEYSDSNFTVKSKYLGSDKITEAFILGLTIATKYKFTIGGAKVNNITDTQWSVTSDAHIYWEKRTSCNVKRDVGFMWGEYEFTITIVIKWKEETAGGNTWVEENLPNETVTSTLTYNQVKATIEDSASIALYGERKPNNEGTIEFPLAETEAQCKRIGENIILDSHRFIKQPDFLINFNPKITVGETVGLTDNKIGYDGDNYFIEEVVHNISINRKTGVMIPRTRIGCVYYA